MHPIRKLQVCNMTILVLMGSLDGYKSASPTFAVNYRGRLLCRDSSYTAGQCGIIQIHFRTSSPHCCQLPYFELITGLITTTF